MNVFLKLSQIRWMRNKGRVLPRLWHLFLWLNLKMWKRSFSYIFYCTAPDSCFSFPCKLF